MGEAHSNLQVITIVTLHCSFGIRELRYMHVHLHTCTCTVYTLFFSLLGL